MLPFSSRASEAPDQVRGCAAAPKGATACLFSGLVAIAAAKLPIPSRTRPISAATPMVLRLKTWESRSPPDLTRDSPHSTTMLDTRRAKTPVRRSRTPTGAGWSSPVARQAHNLKVTGSNPVPATSRASKPARPTRKLSTGEFPRAHNTVTLQAYEAALQLEEKSSGKISRKAGNAGGQTIRQRGEIRSSSVTTPSCSTEQ
jgi:hypothetical protein